MRIIPECNYILLVGDISFFHFPTASSFLSLNTPTAAELQALCLLSAFLFTTSQTIFIHPLPFSAFPHSLAALPQENYNLAAQCPSLDLCMSGHLISPYFPVGSLM